MQIGILGTGNVGRALGAGFIALGHTVMMGSRNGESEHAQAWAQSHGDHASFGTYDQAAEFGELLVLCTLGLAIPEVISAVCQDYLTEKVIIDTTNPLAFTADRPPRLVYDDGESAGELTQRLCPGAKVVKAFNTVGAHLMFRPDLPGGPPDMFICGSDTMAKEEVGAILEQFGWGVVDIGGIEAAHYLEAMAMPWILYGLRVNHWQHAYKLLR